MFLRPGCGIEDAEFATLEWVSRWTTSRLYETIVYGPPVEFEEMYDRQQRAQAGSA